MPVRLCGARGCGNEVTGSRYCPECRSERGQDRKRVTDEQARFRNRLYASKRWRITRRKKLFRDPLCECEGCDAIANEVHHIVAIEDGGAIYAFANLQSLCKPHHSAETQRELRERGR